jgi:hypothetical protein
MDPERSKVSLMPSCVFIGVSVYVCCGHLRLLCNFKKRYRPVVVSVLEGKTKMTKKAYGHFVASNQIKPLKIDFARGDDETFGVDLTNLRPHL